MIAESLQIVCLNEFDVGTLFDKLEELIGDISQSTNFEDFEILESLWRFGKVGYSLIADRLTTSQDESLELRTESDFLHEEIVDFFGVIERNI